jgi:hypothetical protein
MRRAQGLKGIALVECINHYIGKYRIRWDMQDEVSDTEEAQMVSYYETEIISKRRPNVDAIKQAIFDCINQRVDEEIISGFVWKDMPVWLSIENQFNYKAIYDLAVQTNGGNLPATFKFGDSNNFIYYKFETAEEFSDFYLKMISFISNVIAKGWEEKDSINWDDYKL